MYRLSGAELDPDPSFKGQGTNWRTGCIGIKMFQCLIDVRWVGIEFLPGVIDVRWVETTVLYM